jgi:hypothetical protein
MGDSCSDESRNGKQTRIRNLTPQLFNKFVLLMQLLLECKVFHSILPFLFLGFFCFCWNRSLSVALRSRSRFGLGGSAGAAIPASPTRGSLFLTEAGDGLDSNKQKCKNVKHEVTTERKKNLKNGNINRFFLRRGVTTGSTAHCFLKSSSRSLGTTARFPPSVHSRPIPVPEEESAQLGPLCGWCSVNSYVSSPTSLAIVRAGEFVRYPISAARSTCLKEYRSMSYLFPSQSISISGTNTGKKQTQAQTSSVEQGYGIKGEGKKERKKRKKKKESKKERKEKRRKKKKKEKKQGKKKKERRRKKEGGKKERKERRKERKERKKTKRRKKKKK